MYFQCNLKFPRKCASGYWQPQRLRRVLERVRMRLATLTWWRWTNGEISTRKCAQMLQNSLNWAGWRRQRCGKRGLAAAAALYAANKNCSCTLRFGWGKSPPFTQRCHITVQIIRSNSNQLWGLSRFGNEKCDFIIARDSTFDGNKMSIIHSQLSTSPRGQVGVWTLLG